VGRPAGRLRRPVRTAADAARLHRGGGLFLSHGALRLAAVTEAESRALLPFLLTHASSPNYTVRYGWTAGDFVIWDNQATWHYAIDDYGTWPRAYRNVIGA
jgi:taurine dioxygenase